MIILIQSNISQYNLVFFGPHDGLVLDKVPNSCQSTKPVHGFFAASDDKERSEELRNYDAPVTNT